ncbi:MAG: hypothetical protein HQL34_10755, partial [Alphaproteobacteria bacterium]|nr:hypothetical protein [Alphaproteobacteria bacterium]
DSPAHLDSVVFQAGGFRIAAEARHVQGMREGTGEAPVENLIGLDLTRGAGRRILIVKVRSGTDGVEITVSEPVSLVPLPVGHIFPLPPMVAARLSLKGVRAIALDDAGPILLIDLPSIVSSGHK